jgi:hypothetical protein
MKIKQGVISNRSPVYIAQAHFLVKTIHKLERAYGRKFSSSRELSLDEFYEFQESAEYQDFIEATLICGFVCDDYCNLFPLDNAHLRPREILPALTFNKIRHYIHTIQRAEKWNSQYSTVLYDAIRSGALSIVADRLESDMTLYEVSTDS